MAKDINNNNNQYLDTGIEKFQGDFEREELGVTIIPNKTINDIRVPEALGVYVFLLGRPKNWKLNIKHLADHFQCGKDKMYRILNLLLGEKFITCTHKREKGRFLKPTYRVHLSRIDRPLKLVDLIVEPEETHASIDLLPYPENTDAVITDTVKPDAYKTKNINNKEDLKNTIVDSANTTKEKKVKDYKLDELFMKFYSHYPNKQKPVVAHKAFLKHKPTAEFVDMLVNDLKLRLENNWKGREPRHISFPATYLNHKEWEGEIYKSQSNLSKSTNRPKYKSMDDILRKTL